MLEEKIELGIGIVRHLNRDNEAPVSRLSSILQEFGLNKSDLVDITMTYEELCEIHSLAKEIHESVRKLKQ